ncbi:MAG: hypothetical protein O2875_01435 [Planctomycetota bacterium]|nr:hypothetical protein [Planctomycetota bacterium]MDA1262534.1 hypothetical protein [Planctomycetota bacterium]
MSSASFHSVSPLRAQHDEFAKSETARRSAAAGDARGSADSSHATHAAKVAWIPWGESAEIVGVFDRVETEYAAIRRGAALCDLPQRGILEISGRDRIEFLQRMLTQDTKGFSAGQTRESFWLNRKGRIEADLLLCEIGDRILIDCAGAVAANTASTLTNFVFAEEVTIADVSAREYRLAIHGPEALHLLEFAGVDAHAIETLGALHTCVAMKIADISCVLARADSCGVCGIEIFVARTHALALWNSLMSIHDLLQGGQRRGRPCGWHAFNMARIEGGTPLFEVDFGPASLPHETGLIDRRVSFTKGCYLGQEVVARMNSLGKPKQIVRSFRMMSDALPIESAQVFAVGTEGSIGDEVGVVTSSAMSPMLGAACVGFATVRYAHSTAGTELIIAAEGRPERATVQAELAAVKNSVAAESSDKKIEMDRINPHA